MTTHHSDPVRAEIRTLRTYALSPESEVPVRAKLDFNESPYDVPAAVKERVLARLAERRWSVYPAFGAPRLKRAIADSIGRSPEEIAVGNGSGEVILAALSVFAGSGGSVLLAPPTFSLYAQMAAIAGAQPYLVARKGPEFSVETSAILSCLKADDRMVPLVCSPNNPTGGVVPLEQVSDVARKAPIVLLDQAYVDFAAPENDAISLLGSTPNLVIFRTLSKAFSAAGFRIGYAVARPGLVREIEKAVLPFSVDLAAEELALAVLDSPETARATVATVVSERDRVSAAMRAMGAIVADSQANFLFFVPPGGDAPGVRSRLAEQGILIRDMTTVVPDRLRVTIGTPEQNDLFLSALKELPR
ncbi:MAG: histidinol-phosphate transaminase [Thermoanaerobaculia bacterium]